MLRNDVNWRNIARIEDGEVRFFFMTLPFDLPGVSEGFAKGFPDYFPEDPGASEFVFALSEIKRETVNFWEETDEGSDPKDNVICAERDWVFGCKRLGIPIVSFHLWKAFYGRGEYLDPDVRFMIAPPELFQQLWCYRDLEDAIGQIITLRDTKFVVVGSDSCEGSVSLGLAEHTDLAR